MLFGEKFNNLKLIRVLYIYPSNKFIFVNSINVSLKDLDYTKKNGYVEGISSILNKQLEDLNPTDRPIHSTDQKRLKFMVKNKDGWVKDDGSQLNNVVIRETKFKLVKSLTELQLMRELMLILRV